MTPILPNAFRHDGIFGGTAKKADKRAATNLWQLFWYLIAESGILVDRTEMGGRP